MKPSRFPATRNAKYDAKNSITIGVDLDAFNEMLQGMGEEVKSAVRPAAQAAAEVLYRAVLRNVDALGSSTGQLRDSIYQKYSTDKSQPGKAVYHVSWRTSRATLDDKGQRGWSGLATAPHGHLVEYGHIQRYAVNLADDGNWYTLVRPSMRGKPKPKRNASQAVKDAYYVLRKGGPQQIAARPFIRPAVSAFPAAVAAAENKFYAVLNYK